MLFQSPPKFLVLFLEVLVLCLEVLFRVFYDLVLEFAYSLGESEGGNGLVDVVVLDRDCGNHCCFAVTSKRVFEDCSH